MQILTESCKLDNRRTKKDDDSANIPIHPQPQCFIPLEALSNVPAIRLKDLPATSDPKFTQCSNKENTLLQNLPIPCTIICSRKKFLELTSANTNFGGSAGDGVESQPKIPLDKLTLVVCDNVHEALTNKDVKSTVLEILDVVR